MPKQANENDYFLVLLIGDYHKSKTDDVFFVKTLYGG